MIKNMKNILTLIFLMCFASLQVFAEENLFAHIDYPELQVTPRATERLVQLAALEDSSGIALQWTLLASGGMTFYSALKHSKNYRSNTPSASDKSFSDLAASAGYLIGAGWISWGAYVGYKHWAATRLSEIKRYSNKDKRGDLNRERLAEEFLEQTSVTSATVDNLAMYTNLATGFFITCFASDDNRIYGLLAMTTSTLPLLFPNIYTINYEKHMEYKRKIYAPLVGLTFTNKMEPLMALNWSF
jgi:hypothetical protein